MIYAVYLALALVAFLVVLNGFLRGAKKVQIDALLSLLLIGLIIIAFFVSGWKFGLLAIAITLISAIGARPIGARLASRLFAVSSDGRRRYVGLPPRRLQTILQQLGRPIDPNQLAKEMFSGGNRSTDALTALLDYCESQPVIEGVMNEFQVSRDHLRELYHDLLRSGAGQWVSGHFVAASALAYPDSLRYLLVRRKENMQETAYNLIMYFERGAPLETLSS